MAHVFGLPAAIVLYHPNAELLGSLFSALNYNHRRFFLYLNGAVDPAIETRIAALANARVIRNPNNAGLGAGLNALAGAADTEGFSHLQLFDQDSAPEPGLPAALMARFIERAKEFPTLAVVGPYLTTPAHQHYRQNRYSWRDRQRGTVDFVPTSGSILSLAAWRQIGQFKEDYFIGGIDVEWGLRALHLGYVGLIAVDTPMVHRWGTDVARDQYWKPQILRQSEGRNYFYIRNTVDMLRLGFIPLSWRMRFGARLCGQIGLLLFMRGNAQSNRRVVIRALFDGWRGRLGPIPSDFDTIL